MTAPQTDPATPATEASAPLAVATVTPGELPRGAATALDVVALDGDRSAQLNFYTWPSLRLHLQRLVFELKLQDIHTSQAELFNALLALGPPDAPAALRVITTYRKRTGTAHR